MAGAFIGYHELQGVKMGKVKSKTIAKKNSKIPGTKNNKQKKNAAPKKMTQKIKALHKKVTKFLIKNTKSLPKTKKFSAAKKSKIIVQPTKKIVISKAAPLNKNLNDTPWIKKSTATKPLTTEQLAICKKKLIEMRNLIFYKDYAIKEFTIDKNELSDVLDEATINDLMSKEVRLRNREIFHLKKINKGLEMILRGTYGICHDCEEQIPFERLIVRPETDMCISCKEISESEELRNINDKLPKSQGLSMEQVLGR